MIPGRDQPIVPLTMRLVINTPLRWRMIPCIHNRKHKAMFERALSQRTASLVRENWRGSTFGDHFRLLVSDLIAKHFHWSQPLFVPQDECFVLFELWRRGVADRMECEGFTLDMQSLLGLEISGDVSLPTMTYAKFLGALVGTRGHSGHGTD